MFRGEHINFLARLTLGQPAVCPRGHLDVNQSKKFMFMCLFSPENIVKPFWASCALCLPTVPSCLSGMQAQGSASKLYSEISHSLSEVLQTIPPARATSLGSHVLQHSQRCALSFEALGWRDSRESIRKVVWIAWFARTVSGFPTWTPVLANRAPGGSKLRIGGLRRCARIVGTLWKSVNGEIGL